MDPKRRAIVHALRKLNRDPNGSFVVDSVLIFEERAFVTFADGAAVEFRKYRS